MNGCTFTLERSEMISLAPARTLWSLTYCPLLREHTHPRAPSLEDPLEEAALERRRDRMS